jgi:hypothetical protein
MRLIEYLLKVTLSPDKVLHYQNVSVMLLSLYTLVILYNPVRIGYYDPLTNTIMTVASIVNMFLLEKPDMLVHHICLLLFVFFRNYFTVYGYYGTLITNQLLQNELSTMVYVVGHWIPKKYAAIKTVNRLIFLAVFYKFRVHDMFYTIVVNRNLYIELNSIIGNRLIGYITSWGALYTLYGLNVYWFIIILKKMYNSLCIKYDSHAAAEYLLQYTYDVCLLICLYVYLYESRINYAYFYDIFGVAVLAISSGAYHGSNYYLIQTEGEDFNRFQYPNIMHYFLDNVAIHLRVFMAALTNTLIRSSMDPPISIYLVGAWQALSCGMIAGILLYVGNNRLCYTYTLSNPAVHKYSAVIRILILLSSCMSAMIINMSTNDLNHIGHNYMVLYLLVLVSIIRPFYKMNHVLIHIILMYSTWVLCKINTSITSS